MRCPNCRCEVGNQSVCPYCGATVYLGDTAWNMNQYSRNPTQQYAQGRERPQKQSSKSISRRLQRLETKVELLLVLQGGAFLLTVLALIIIVLK